MFRELVADPDPASLDIALDTLEEAGLNLVEVSEAFYRENLTRIRHRHVERVVGEIGARGWFDLHDEDGDHTQSVWSVERDYGSGAGENWRVVLYGRFHNKSWFYEVSRRFKDIEFAIDRAITDAWFAVNVMRLRYIATGKQVVRVIDILEAAGHGDYDESTIEKMSGANVWRRKPTNTAVRQNPKKKSVGVAETGVFGFVGNLLGTAVNPSMTAEEAVVAFKDLIRDPDPAAMQIAEDLALEHKLSLVDLSVSGQNGMHGYFSLHPLYPADAPNYRVEWSVDPLYLGAGYPREKSRFVIGLRYVWNNQAETLIAPGGRYMSTREGARRAAAADAWAIAKRMKRLMAEGRADADPRPMFTTQRDTIHEILLSAFESEDKTAPELYEHRPRGKKQRTYIEARDDIWAQLERETGWLLSSSALRLPYATSPSGRLRLWFKPQAVHYTVGTNHAQGNARSVDYDLDIRKMTPTEFLDLVKRKFPGGFR